ncbi:MAG: hypothetical protein QOH95_1450 [Gaiellaceae bacterium]|nr:hypothetical protein [Gaiellaceae bacterium]
MAAMGLLTWISLLFLVLALAVSVTIAVRGGLRAWRAFRGLTGATTAALDDVVRTASEAEGHAVAFSDGSEQLSAAIARLQRSLAELGVLGSALSDARASLLSFRGAVPRK